MYGCMYADICIYDIYTFILVCIYIHTVYVYASCVELTLHAGGKKKHVILE